MPGYFIYSRKSTEAEDRQVLSIDSQVNELRQTAARLAFPIVDVLTEAKSAKAPGRPVFNAMMQRLYRGEAQGVLCWKLDRLARNPVDGGAVIWAIKQHDIKVVTPAQTFGQADDNVILMYIEFGMAQKYIDDLSKNVKRGLKAKAEQGWHPGFAPLGYLNGLAKEPGERRVLKDPERFPLVRRMWDLMLTGRYAPPEILRIANEEWGFKTKAGRRRGGTPLAQSAFYRLFSNPFYYGWFEYPQGSGQWHRGKHEAMVTEAEFERVQTMLGRRSAPRPSVHRSFAFTGAIRCGECGAMVTAEEKRQVICGVCRVKFSCRNRSDCPRCRTRIEEMRRPTFLRYVYYHCSKSRRPRCPQGSIVAKELERQVDEYLGRIELSPRFTAWAMQYLHELHAEEVEARNTVLGAQQKAYRDCLARLDHLVKLKTSPANATGSLLSDQEYGTQRFALLKEKARLEELLTDTGHRVDRWLALSEQTFAFARIARKRFAKGDPQTKREILAAIQSNLTLKDKTLKIDAKKQFLIMEKSLDPAGPETGAIEPGAFRARQRQTADAEGWRPIGSGIREEVRTYGPRMRAMVEQIYRFFQKSDLSALAPLPQLD